MAGNKPRGHRALQCKCSSDKQLKKFIHSAELQLSGRKINTNLMRGSKTNSAVVLSTQNSREREGERRGRFTEMKEGERRGGFRGRRKERRG